MSSFINTRKHFDSIAAGTMRLYRAPDFYFPQEFKNITPILWMEGMENAAEKRIMELTEALMCLQIRCVCHQDKTPEAIGDCLTYMKCRQTSPLQLSPIPLHKAIACALYQIETRHLERVRPLTDEERQCLLFFNALRLELADFIVTRLPEYEKYPWAIE